MIGAWALLGKMGGAQSLVQALLKDDWREAIREARRLSRHTPGTWGNVSLVVEQAAALAGAPSGSRGAHLAKIGAVEFKRGSPPGDSGDIHENASKMISPIVLRDPLTKLPWAIVERPFAGSMTGAPAVLIELHELSERLLRAPAWSQSGCKVRGELEAKLQELRPLVKAHREIERLARTDKKKARDLVHRRYMEAFIRKGKD